MASIVTIIGYCVLCSAPGVLVGKALHERGYVQDYKVKPIVLTSMLVIATQLISPHISPIALVLFGILFSSVGVYRADFYNRSTWGAWWWQTSEQRSNPYQDIVITLAVIAICVAAIWWLNK